MSFDDFSADFYFDTTFCVSPDCRCGKRLTADIVNAAKILWASYDIDGCAPIAMMYRCGTPPGAPPITIARPAWVEALLAAPITPPPLRDPYRPLG